ncbi:uncharacterized protein KZ484_004610 isoform 2-T2 [Pholidichthys leucotaenia]
MGGLGNGRRGGRSPPLMIAALIACILVLGFNYWVSSSRNLELQTKLYELEGQVRRGVAERGAVESTKSKFEEEIQKQKQQISNLESFYRRELEGLQNTCTQEKTMLQQNISSSTKTIQELKGQLNDDVGRLQKELQSCQGSINTLNSKLKYDMNRCKEQVQSQKELCDERMAKAKLEVQTKMEKLIPPQGASTQHATSVDDVVKEDRPAKTLNDGAHSTTVINDTQTVLEHKGNEPPELLTNDIIIDRDPHGPQKLFPVKVSSNAEPQLVPSAAAVKQEIVQEGAAKTDEVEAEPSNLMKNNLTEDNGVELIDIHEEGAQTEADPGMEGMLIDRGKVEDNPVGQKLEEPDEYDAEEQVVGGVDLEKRQQSNRENNDKDMEEELADYNGDDENEGEFEADKQAALAQT